MQHSKQNEDGHVSNAEPKSPAISSQLKDFQTQFSALTTQIDKAESNALLTKREIICKNEMITQLQTEVGTKEEQIKNLQRQSKVSRTTITMQSSEIAKLKRICREKSNEITKLKKRCADKAFVSSKPIDPSQSTALSPSDEVTKLRQEKIKILKENVRLMKKCQTEKNIAIKKEEEKALIQQKLKNYVAFIDKLFNEQ